MALFLLKRARSVPFFRSILSHFYTYESPRLASTVAGLRFPNPVGLAAGLDKTGEMYPALAHMGFGFIECGTFTAEAQPGNPRPRLFRLPEYEAIVNRMGFNNPGAANGAKIFASQNRTTLRGINLGKSKVTPIERSLEDYRKSLAFLSPFADYIAINVSSPNTPGLRSLQKQEALHSLLSGILADLKQIRLDTNRLLPLFVKLAPDLSDTELSETVEVAIDLKLDGIILTNTTLDHSSIPNGNAIEGGVSGAPLRKKSTQMIRRAFELAGKRIAIIGVGGIFSGADALEKILAGASLVQIYTGYIYGGPSLPAAINRTIDAYLAERQVTLDDIIGTQNKI